MTTAPILMALRPRTWLHLASGLCIWLPDDKRTFRVVNADWEYVTPKRFRTREGAVKFIERTTADVDTRTLW